MGRHASPHIASSAKIYSYTEPYISEIGSETGRLPPMESGADGAHPESRVGTTALEPGYPFPTRRDAKYGGAGIP
jgi:hypothetical protein